MVPTEKELLEGLNEYTAHADELAEPMADEIPPYETLHGPIDVKSLRGMISARRIVSTEDMKAAIKRLQQSKWDSWFADCGVSEDYGESRDQPIPQKTSPPAEHEFSPLEKLKGSVTHLERPTDPAADWEEWSAYQDDSGSDHDNE